MLIRFLTDCSQANQQIFRLLAKLIKKYWNKAKLLIKLIKKLSLARAKLKKALIRFATGWYKFRFATDLLSFNYLEFISVAKLVQVLLYSLRNAWYKFCFATDLMRFILKAIAVSEATYKKLLG